jgi:DNA (cytosine-5)-methyltransferase 1
MSPPPSFIEVCAGCGGLSTGFMEAGFTPILLNELVGTFCETLKRNHPGVPVKNGDMKGLNLTEFKRKVDVLMGGVPCQSFSHAGVRKGTEDPRGKLIIEFNRLVNECEPKVFMVENVKGLLTHDKGATFEALKTLFANDGKYRVYHKLLNAVDYGVPQKRERVLIVGVRSDFRQSEFQYPEKKGERKLLKDVLVDVPPGPGITYSEEKKRVMDMVPQGGCWVDLPEDVQREYMGEKSLKAGGGKRGMARRLSMNEPSLTLTTSPCQKQTERCHPLETRPLSVREYARIQTFPDSYVFCGGTSSQYKQIGNAVPVRLAHAMATQIKSYLGQ